MNEMPLFNIASCKVDKNKNKIKQKDLDSGKVVKNKNGTFWFKKPGNNMQDNNWPILENLYRDNGLPSMILRSGSKFWWKNGKQIKKNTQINKRRR